MRFFISFFFFTFVGGKRNGFGDGSWSWQQYYATYKQQSVYGHDERNIPFSEMNKSIHLFCILLQKSVLSYYGFAHCWIFDLCCTCPCNTDTIRLFWWPHGNHSFSLCFRIMNVFSCHGSAREISTFWRRRWWATQVTAASAFTISQLVMIGSSESRQFKLATPGSVSIFQLYDCQFMLFYITNICRVAHAELSAFISRLQKSRVRD